MYRPRQLSAVLVALVDSFVRVDRRERHAEHRRSRACVLTSVALAVATYLFVEKPIRFGVARPLKIPALAAASLLVGIIGYATFARHGLPARFPPQVQSLANFQYEFKTDARYPDCWLSAEQPFDGFAPSCASAAGASTSPSSGEILTRHDSIPD